MAVEVEIDVQVLKSEIKKTYASVSQEPEKDFIFPTGRPWAEDLGYPEELATVPETAVRSFAGVANLWQLGRLKAGERVLDLGSGAGTDSLVAAKPFKRWQLSWVPREMNREADKLVDQAFKGEPVTHATD